MHGQKEMFLHKKVVIPDLDAISQEISNIDFGGDPHGFRILGLGSVSSSLPTLWKWFSAVNAQPSRVCYINLKPGTSQQIHIDTGPMELALNMPVSGCLGSHTRVFENKGRVVTAYTTTNLTFSKYIDDDPVEISRFVLDSPTLINIKMPHQVVNDTDHNRICLSFRFTPDPWHLIKE